MKVVRRSDPFSFVPGLFNDPFFNDVAEGRNDWVPSVNVKESDKAFSIQLVAPGMEKENFALELEKEVLVISAEVSKEKEEKEEKFTKREFATQSFKRSFTLPLNLIDLEQIEANHKNGILEVNIPKKEKEVPAKRTISIG